MEIITARKKMNALDIKMFNAHMHLIAMPQSWLYKTPAFNKDVDYTLTDEGRAIAELDAYTRSGGESALDVTCRDYGRNSEAIEKMVKRSNENFTVVTGFNRGICLDSSYYEKTVNELSELWSEEVEKGIENTSLRAGVIKVCMGYMHLMPVAVLPKVHFSVS